MIFIVGRTDQKAPEAKAIEAKSLTEAAGLVLAKILIFAKGDITVKMNTEQASFTYSVDPDQPSRTMVVKETGDVYG